MLGMYGHDEYANYYELELGTPWANQDAYDRVSFPFLHADRIATPTLFYCAGADFNVPCLGSEQMYQALRSQDIPTQLVIYPEENHALTVPSYLRDRLSRHIDLVRPVSQGRDRSPWIRRPARGALTARSTVSSPSRL